MNCKFYPSSFGLYYRCISSLRYCDSPRVKLGCSFPNAVGEINFLKFSEITITYVCVIVYRSILVRIFQIL